MRRNVAQYPHFKWLDFVDSNDIFPPINLEKAKSHRGINGPKLITVNGY